MAAGSEDEDVAVRLHAWATKEMHFYPQGAFQGASMPKPEDLRRICRGAHQTDVWNYVINYVCSVQTVKKVKGNLQLRSRSGRHGYTVKYKSDGRYDNEQQSLLTRKVQLQEEITAVLSETQQLENELERMARDIQDSELQYQKEMESVRDISRKMCLLQLYAHTADDFNAHIDAFADRIVARMDSFIKGKRGVDTALHTRLTDAGTGDAAATELETATSRDVRVSCDQIGKFLHQTLQGTFSKDKASFHQNKDQLWKQVETTLSNHNVEQILDSLVRQSQQGAQLLREHTMKISIHKDAEKLRFKYEKGGLLRDMAAEPSVLQSVHQLLEEGQLQHVMRFVEQEKHHNMARPLQHKLEKTRSRITSLLKKHFTGQPGNVEMANMLIQCQLDLVADTMARDCYKQEAEKLCEKLSLARQQQDALLTLHRKIQDFQELANAKQSLIQVVAKQNGGAKSRLAAQQLDVSQYIARSIPTHDIDTQTLTAGLRGTVAKEVDKFCTLSLPYLVFLYLDSETKCSLLDLSIHHLSHPTAISVRQALHTALAHLHFPTYKAAECVLQHCLQLKQEQAGYEQLTQALETHCFKIMLASGVEVNIANISELCDKVRSCDRQELDKLLPVLQKRISKAARASTECIKVKDFVQAWWEQPAQFTTPWVKVQDQTFQQWFNTWKIVVTKIRQLDVHK